MEEENGYFKQVVKDALKDLKKHGCTYVFFEEQIKVIQKELKNKKIKIDFDGTLYKLSIDK